MIKKCVRCINVLIIILLLSCNEEDKISSREYPLINTLPVSNITENGASFSAEITYRGGFEILSYGFAWSTAPNPVIASSERVIILGEPDGLTFSSQVNSSLKVENTYYVRPFVITKDYTVYGSTVKFLSLGANAPIINSIFPLSVHYRDTVTISGQNFSYLKSSVQVKLGDNPSKVVVTTDTLVQVIVSDEISSPSFNVQLSIQGNSTVSSELISFKPPEITSISNPNPVFGDTISINGKYFGFTADQNTVLLNETEVSPIFVGNDRLDISIPAVDKKFNISISNTASQSTTSPEITIPDPIIDSITPDSGFWGDEIVLKGENFGQIQGIAQFRCNGILAKMDSFSNTKIVASLPSDINNPIEIVLSVNSTLSNSISFYYLGPEVVGFAPEFGTWGDTIVLRGNNFSSNPTDNEVKMNDYSADILESSKDKITFKVPNELDSKSSAVTIEVNNLIEEASSFTLNDPVVESITPSELTDIDQSVTIRGANFNPIQANNSIQFNELSLEVLSSSPTDITVLLDELILDNPLVSEIVTGSFLINNSIGSDFSEDLRIDYTTAWRELPNRNFDNVTEIINDEGRTYLILNNTQIFEFNFSSNSWRFLTSFPGEVGYDGNRYRGSGFLIDDFLYYGMGLNARTGCSTNPNIVCPGLPMNDFWRYSISTNSWSKLNETPLSGNGITGFTVSGRSFIISDEGFYEYDSSDDTWMAKDNIPENFYSYNLLATVGEHEVFVYYTQLSEDRSIQKYDPINDTWTFLFSNPDFRYVEDMEIIDSNIYFTKLSFPIPGSNNYISELIRLNTITLETEALDLPEDQTVLIPCKRAGKLYFDGYNASDGFYVLDTQF